MDGLRDELLAGARFAGDEHGRRGRRRLLDHLVDLPHLRAVADERSERAVLAQLAPQRLHLAHRLQAFDDLVEENLQPLDIDGLRQVVVGAFLHRLDGGVDGALRGQEQRRDVGADLRQRAQQREPVHTRHHQVGDDDGGPEGGDLLERFLAVARRVGDEAPALDKLLEAHARRRVVFDDQDALGSDVRFFVNDINSAGCGCRHSAPRPCHFYILAPEHGRCKLNCLIILTDLKPVADSLHARNLYEEADAIDDGFWPQACWRPDATAAAPPANGNALATPSTAAPAPDTSSGAVATGGHADAARPADAPGSATPAAAPSGGR